MPQTIADYSRPSVPVSQTGKITFVIVLGFLVFVTLRGRLAAYVNLLFASKGKAVTSSPSGGSSSTPQPSAAPVHAPSSTAPETGSQGGGNVPSVANDVEIYNETGQFLAGSNSGTNGPSITDGYY